MSTIKARPIALQAVTSTANIQRHYAGQHGVVGALLVIGPDSGGCGLGQCFRRPRFVDLVQATATAEDADPTSCLLCRRRELLRAGGHGHSRAVLRDDRKVYRLAVAVLAGNELWNVAFFGRRSTRAGLFGILAFTVPLCRLQASVVEDRASTLALSPYTAWVIGYDLPWTYRIWRLNP